MSDSCRAAIKVAGTALAAVALCLAMVMGLAACGGDDNATEMESTDTTADDTVTSEAGAAIDEALLGKWHSAQTSETLEFTADGKMIITADDGAVETVEFPYRVEGANVVYGPAGYVLTLPYSIDGEVLTIVNPDVGGSVTLDRVR